MRPQQSYKLCVNLIEKYNINLDGLTVYTEAATGPYLWNAVLAAKAGARVFAQTADSRFGTVGDVRRATLTAAAEYGVADRVEVVAGRDLNGLRVSDIVTNSGFVRPFDSELIDALKSTAVVPLMWETWELREDEFDLERCRARGILVLGTNELAPPCDMSEYVGYTGLKLLFEAGFDGGNVLLLGSAPLPSRPILHALRQLGISVTWGSMSPEADVHYDEMSQHFAEYGSRYDAVILAEHQHPVLLLGKGGLLEFDAIGAANPELKIGIMCGRIDAEGLSNTAFSWFPRHLQPFGFLSYQPYMLGRRPVLTLFAAGLKVGQVMSRARLRGLAPSVAAEEALRTSPAMDFSGTRAWLADARHKGDLNL